MKSFQFFIELRPINASISFVFQWPVHSIDITIFLFFNNGWRSLIIGPCSVSLIIIVVSCSPLIFIVSDFLLICFHFLSDKYWFGFFGFTFSIKKSKSSVITFVKPHAHLSVWPKIGTGIPAIHNPLVLKPPPLRCISYHLVGCLKARWGSLAKKGFPVLVLFPDTTQLFEPISEEGCPKIFLLNSS